LQWFVYILREASVTMRLLITWLTVDSAEDVEIFVRTGNDPHHLGCWNLCWPRGGDAFHNSFPGERLSGISAGV
jgi:hypothetical protein